MLAFLTHVLVVLSSESIYGADWCENSFMYGIMTSSYDKRYILYPCELRHSWSEGAVRKDEAPLPAQSLICFSKISGKVFC